MTERPKTLPRSERIPVGRDGSATVGDLQEVSVHEVSMAKFDEIQECLDQASAGRKTRLSDLMVKVVVIGTGLSESAVKRLKLSEVADIYIAVLRVNSLTDILEKKRAEMTKDPRPAEAQPTP